MLYFFCREAVVVSVKNLAGFVSVNADGSWLCISDHKHKEEHHPDPVSHNVHNFTPTVFVIQTIL